MKIPEFKPSNKFLGDTDLPCLIAKVKNSNLPGGIATQYIKSFKKDPVCEIYLRSKDTKNISAWQEEMLKRLFVNAEWTAAIGPDLKRCEANYGEDYLSCGLEPAETRYLKKHGLLPFFAIRCVVVDDTTRKVLMSVDTSMVDEHGLAIYLSKGRWRLGDWDHFGRYSHCFDAHREARNERKVDERQKQWDVRWAGFFPIPEPSEPVEPDISVLYGEWEYDRQITSKILKKVGEPKDFISKCLAFGGVYSKYRFSRNEVKEYTKALGTTTWRVLKCERYGSRVRIEGTCQIKRGNKGNEDTVLIRKIFNLCCFRDRLVARGGYDVYRRVAKSDRKG